VLLFSSLGLPPALLAAFGCVSVTNHASASYGFFGGTAARYSTAEDVRILPVVISELKLRDVQRHVLGADLECANNTALHQRPKALNRVGVGCADNIFLGAMANERVRISLSEFVVSPFSVTQIRKRFRSPLNGSFRLNKA
jgi:hypothetical protein